MILLEEILEWSCYDIKKVQIDIQKLMNRKKRLRVILKQIIPIIKKRRDKSISIIFIILLLLRTYKLSLDLKKSEKEIEYISKIFEETWDFTTFILMLEKENLKIKNIIYKEVNEIINHNKNTKEIDLVKKIREAIMV